MENTLSALNDKKVCTTIIFRFGLTSDCFKSVNEESLTRQESLGIPD